MTLLTAGLAVILAVALMIFGMSALFVAFVANALNKQISDGAGNNYAVFCWNLGLGLLLAGFILRVVLLRWIGV